jgi:hypothetical protein
MGSKQKRRIARMERELKHAAKEREKDDYRFDSMQRTISVISRECDRLKRLLEIEFVPDEKDLHLLALRLHFDRHTFLMMRSDPAEVIAREVYAAVKRSGHLPSREVTYEMPSRLKGAPDGK